MNAPRGWIDIGSDGSWEDYGGNWARKSPDGSYYVVVFTNMIDACGERDLGDGDKFLAEVRRVVLSDIDSETLRQARKCVGLDLETVDEPHRELAQVEACSSYGAYAPIESFSANGWASRVRSQAFRCAEQMMKDAAAVEVAMAKPVNKIGSTAHEYMRGDINAALDRGPFDPTKNLMRKMHGLPPESEET